MNDVYFACSRCKNYVDAGYRWAVSVLLPNRWEKFPIAVSAQEVLSNGEYLSAASDQPHYAKALPPVRRFLVAHAEHNILFGDAESFMNFDDAAHSYLEWLDEGSLDEPVQRTLCFEPRYFAEHQALLYTSWKQVEEHCVRTGCAWAGNPAATEAAEKIFTRAASGHRTSEA